MIKESTQSSRQVRFATTAVVVQNVEGDRIIVFASSKSLAHGVPFSSFPFQ